MKTGYGKYAEYGEDAEIYDEELENVEKHIMKTEVRLNFEYSGTNVSTPRHAMQLLLEGHILKYGPSYYKLDPLFNSIKVLVTDIDNIDWRCTMAIDIIRLTELVQPQVYHEIEIKEPEWYENIPTKGMLCKISDVDENALSIRDLAVVVAYNSDQSYPFVTLTKAGTLVSHKLAVPVTLNELRDYMNED